MYTQLHDSPGSTRVGANHAEPGGDVGFRQLAELFGRHKLSMIAIVACFTLAPSIAVLFVHKRFEAVAKVSPVTDQSNEKANGLMSSSLGDLAALTGISPASGGKKSESVATLQSEALTETYIRENNLLPILYAADWDAKSQKWKSDGTQTPTLWKANKVFNEKIRKVTEDPKSGLITISILWKDPVMAAKWANGLIKLTNDYLRNKTIAESERRIAYLSDQAARTNAIEVKTSIYALIASEIKSQTLARGTDEYALKVIDPAFVPETSSYPARALWVGLGLLSGIVASIVFALIRDEWELKVPRSQ